MRMVASSRSSRPARSSRAPPCWQVRRRRGCPGCAGWPRSRRRGPERRTRCRSRRRTTGEVVAVDRLAAVGRDDVRLGAAVERRGQGADHVGARPVAADPVTGVREQGLRAVRVERADTDERDPVGRLVETLLARGEPRGEERRGRVVVARRGHDGDTESGERAEGAGQDAAVPHVLRVLVVVPERQGHHVDDVVEGAVRLRLRLTDQQLVEGDAQLVLLDDAVARHHADGEHRRVRTGLSDDARDERAVAGLAVEQAELRLEDDAGHLGVRHVVADPDRLAVDVAPSVASGARASRACPGRCRGRRRPGAAPRPWCAPASGVDRAR